MFVAIFSRQTINAHTRRAFMLYGRGGVRLHPLQNVRTQPPKRFDIEFESTTRPRVNEKQTCFEIRSICVSKSMQIHSERGASL